MKQLRKTEWQKGYPIKKPGSVCVCPCLGGRSPNIATPDQILQKTYHSMPALNKRLTKEEQEELVEHVEIRECLRNNG